MALNIPFCLPRLVLRNVPTERSTGPNDLQVLEHMCHALLNVVLHERLSAFPPEALGERTGRHGALLGELQSC